jgi:hypothetical protein
MDRTLPVEWLSWGFLLRVGEAGEVSDMVYTSQFNREPLKTLV